MSHELRDPGAGREGVLIAAAGVSESGVTSPETGVSPGLAPSHNACPSPRPRGQTSGDGAQGSWLGHSKGCASPPPGPLEDALPAPGPRTLLPLPNQAPPGLPSAPNPPILLQVTKSWARAERHPWPHGQGRDRVQPQEQLSPHLQIFQVCILQLLEGREDLEPRRTRWKRVCEGKETLGRPR